MQFSEIFKQVGMKIVDGEVFYLREGLQKRWDISEDDMRTICASAEMEFKELFSRDEYAQIAESYRAWLEVIISEFMKAYLRQCDILGQQHGHKALERLQQGIESSWR